jgi:hypothetical protein
MISDLPDDAGGIFAEDGLDTKTSFVDHGVAL